MMDNISVIWNEDKCLENNDNSNWERRNNFNIAVDGKITGIKYILHIDVKILILNVQTWVVYKHL